jgi:predicted nucleotidyltransferase
MIMRDKEFFNSIKTTVLSYLPGAKVLLFGSMARENSNTHSDYDLLIVTKNPINSIEKMNMETRISKSLVYLLHVPFDVLVYSQQEVELKKNAKGLILYHALKDAIEL